MKKILILLIITISFWFFIGINWAFAAVNIPGTDNIRDVSLNLWSWTSDIAGEIRNIWLYTFLPIIKRIIMGILVIFLVYTGAMMIMSMGSNEEQLSSSKRQIWYAVVAILFINIPGSLYNSFYQDGTKSLGNTISTGNFSNATTESTKNLFFNVSAFQSTLWNQIIFFLEIMIFIWAIFMITLAGIQLMTSRGREEKLKEAKNKVLYTILALVFIWIIEAWKDLAFGGEISDGINLFETLSSLALFFAAPIAIFFLTLSGYYYLTSNGNEEQIKKAKSIIINTLLATLILLAAYTFLLDLATL